MSYFPDVFPTLGQFYTFLYNQDFYSHKGWIVPQQAPQVHKLLPQTS